MMLEEKVFVITSIRWKLLERIILSDPDYKKIKQVKVCSFYWIDNDKGYEENARHIREMIDADPAGFITMFQLCPVINGKRDLFSCARTREQKRMLPYFQQEYYEITEQELQAFVDSNQVARPRRFSNPRMVLNCINLDL